MDDFDDICGVLDDLADFDVSSFGSTPASQPTPAQVTPVQATPAPAPTPAQPSNTGSYNLDVDLDFGMDFGPPTTAPAAQPTQPVTLDIDDNDLSLNDIIDNLDFGIPTEPARKPAPQRREAPQPMNKPGNGPQVMNMQPANGPRPGSPQVMNMQPANGPQVMNMQPANARQGSPQVMNMQPANGPQVMNMQPGNARQGSPQVMNMQPANGPRAMNQGSPQIMNMQPGNARQGSPQVMNMQPANGPQVMNMQPGNARQGSPQVMNMQPANGPQVMNMQAANGPRAMNQGGPQVMNMQPANGPQVMNMQPANGPKVMNMQPGNMNQGGPQVMNMQPGNRPQVMNMQPANGPQVMNMQPANGPKVMNMQPGNMNQGGAQVMNMQPANGPQVMNMQPANGPKIMNQSSEVTRPASAPVEDAEWPDPVKKEIEVRELTEGRNKMILTLLLADRSTKKVFVTDDFTCEDLLNMFASKLHLWQTEFFELCVHDSKEDADRWLDRKKTLLEERIADQQEVMMKVKYFKTPKKIVDPAAIRLYYIEVKQCIISGTYPTSEKLAVRLAAHQVHLAYGNYVPSKHHPGFLGEALKDYLPREILAVNQPEYIESRIFQLHRNLVGKSNEEVMESYIDLAQQIQTYGSSIYLVKEKLGRTKRVAVAEDGVLISTDDNPKKFHFYSFKIIGGWKRTSDGFDIEIIAPNQKLLEFEASDFKSESIIELMCAYYLFLLGVDSGELPLVSLPMQPEGLPNPKMFQKPNTALKRNLQDQCQTRLELFKDELARLSKKKEITMNRKLLMQVDNAIDQDLVLETLDLSRSGLLPDDLRLFVDAVAKAFEYLPKEDEFFEDNMSITRLDLSSNPIVKGGDVDAFGRVFCTSGWMLKHLTARNIHLTGKLATLLNGYLSKNDFLESIDLEDNDLKMKGVSSILKPLKGQERICSFNFNNNGVTGAGYFLAQVVAKNLTMTELRVGGNKFDDKQLNFLLEGLKLNKGLQTLDLSNCGISTGSGRAVLGWLSSNRTLRTLIIGGNSFGSTWGSALVKMLKAGSALSALDVAKTGIGSKATRGILESVKEHRAIRELTLSGNGIDKKGGQILCECIGSRSINLRKVFIQGCGIHKATMAELGKNLQQNTTLREFDASGNDIKDMDSAGAWGQAIKVSQTLEKLYLCGCGIQGEVLGPIADGLKSNKGLEHLYLDGNSKMGKTSFPTVSGFSLSVCELISSIVG